MGARLNNVTAKRYVESARLPAEEREILLRLVKSAGDDEAALRECVAMAERATKAAGGSGMQTK